jgi:hypothetical protein
MNTAKINMGVVISILLSIAVSAFLLLLALTKLTGGLISTVVCVIVAIVFYVYLRKTLAGLFEKSAVARNIGGILVLIAMFGVIILVVNPQPFYDFVSSNHELFEGKAI